MSFTRSQKRLLWVLRSLSILICLGLLFWPLIRRESVRSDLPWVIVMNDASSSVLNGLQDTAQWTNKVQQFVDQLSKNHQVKVLSFGQTVTEGVADFCNQSLTHFDPAFQYIQTHYSGQPIAAVVLLSDGIHNLGSAANQGYASLAYPFYAVALGDTANYCDLRIQRVHKNAYAVLGHRFPVEMDLSASLAIGEHYELTVTRDGRVLYQQKIKVEHREDARRITFALEADRVGSLWYRAELKPLQHEQIRSNNTFDFSIDVLDAKKSILLLGAAAHPDLAAIKQALSSKSFTVEVALMARFKGQFSRYDAVLLHNLPQQKSHLDLIDSLMCARKPIGLFLSSACSADALQRLPTGLKIKVTHPSDNEAQWVNNTNFSAFTADPLWEETLPSWPPVRVPFGTYQVHEQAQVLAYQRILGQVTSTPMSVLYQTSEGVRCVNWVGDGFWRWRLEDYAQQETHDRFDTWLYQSINYLTQSSDPRQFKVDYEAQVPQWQSIEMRAELYDESRQPMREADIKLNIYDSDGALYPFHFVQDGLHYRAQVGSLMPGMYRFEALANEGKQEQRFSGSFRVFTEHPEQRDLRARYRDLSGMAETYGGIMVAPDQMDQVLDHLSKRNDIKAVRHIEHRYVGLIDLVWIAIVLLLLLSTEWFLRKYWGHY